MKISSQPGVSINRALNIITSPARYVESRLMQRTWKDFDINKESWMQSSASFRFFYATGFNQLRLLDKLGVPYKLDFFNSNALTPYSLLMTAVQPSSIRSL